MNSPFLRPRLLATLGALVFALPLPAEKAKLVTYAKTYGDTRAPAANRPAPSVVIAEGQLSPGAAASELEAVPFPDLADTIAGVLQTEGYIRSYDEDAADLILVVHRGCTDPQGRQDIDPANVKTSSAAGALPQPVATSGRLGVNPSLFGAPAMNDLPAGSGNRDQIARVLGYHERIAQLSHQRGNEATAFLHEEIAGELAQPRYYIVLAAYDGKALRQTGRRVLRWETRLSFLAENKSFADRYAAMLAAGGKHFGRNDAPALDRRFVSID